MFKNSFVYMAGQGISSLISLILLPIYTRLLTPNEFGIASLFIMTIFLGITLFSFGLNTGYMIKYFKVDEVEKKKLFSIVMSLFLVILPILIVILPFTALFRKIFGFNFTFFHLIILGLAIFAGLYYQFFVALLKVQQKAKVFVFFNIGYAIFLGSFNLVLLIIFRQSYMSFLYAMFLVNIIFALVGVLYFQNYFIQLSFKDEKSSVRTLFRISWPIIPLQISSSALSSTDRYILNALVGANPVGLYSVGYRFFTLIENFLLYPLFNSYNPVAYELFAKNKVAFEELQKKYLIYYTLIMAAVFMFVSIFFEDLFKLVFDQRYWPAYSTIGILALAQFLQGFSFLFNTVQTMFEKLYYFVYLILAAALFNIILNFILISKYSFFGAAVATMLSYLFIAIGSYLINQRFLKIGYNILTVCSILFFCISAILFQHKVHYSVIFVKLAVKTTIALTAILICFLFNKGILKNYFSAIFRCFNLKAK